MKPLPGDHRHRLLITGDELRELKRHTGAMAEAFGLDRKIDNYKGSRPITLYRWDLECLMDVIDQALKDERDCPDRASAAYLTLKNLGERLHHEYDSVYGHEGSPPTLVSKKTTGRTLKKPSTGKAAWSDDKVYQFKVTLLDSRPPVWRRIQVKDGTLDKLHEHIQTAMGWTNSHLHRFRINGKDYGDPDLLYDDVEPYEFEDSTSTRIADILPKSGEAFRFEYQYDFGDCWEHEVLFEGCLRAEQGGRYPVCVEGARACPPEDVGGIPGYEEYKEGMADPEHERHEEYMGWRGPFDPEAFDAAKATRRMWRGLPNWRSERWISI
jgi:hypothetical protein